MFLNEDESAKSRLKYITTTHTPDTLHPQHHSIKEKMESHVFVANDQYRWDGVSLPSICRKFRIGGGRSSHGITKLCRTCFTRDSNLMDGEGREGTQRRDAGRYYNIVGGNCDLQTSHGIQTRRCEPGDGRNLSSSGCEGGNNNHLI